MTTSNLTPLETKAVDFLRKKGVNQQRIDKILEVGHAMRALPDEDREVFDILLRWQDMVSSAFSRVFALTQTADIPEPLLHACHRLQKDITEQSYPVTPDALNETVSEKAHGASGR